MRAVVCMALAMLAIVPTARAMSAYPADAVKAVFLYRFAGYVQWPAAQAAEPTFTIAVIGAPQVVTQLSQLLPDHPVQGKPAHVLPISSAGELGDAQMLYIGPDYQGDLRALIAMLADRPVLVVTDEPGALADGSIVNFLIDQQHVRFEVSTRAARRAGLKISSDLLAVAERVETGELQREPFCRPFDEHHNSCSLLLLSYKRVALR
jgi:hypothetical protein